MGGAAALLMGVALAFGACSGSGSGNGGNATNAPDSKVTSAPVATKAGGNEGGLAGAVNAFSSIKSYKFSLTMKGGTYGDLLGKDPISGTIVVDPPAAEMSLMGMQIREVGGKSYVKMGESWIESTDSSTTSMAQSMSPAKLFGSYLGADLASGYKQSGEEQKNGIATLHYVASADVMGEYGSLLGVTGGNWSAEVWIPKSGGYPVSMKLANTGGTSDFLFAMDITNVNDSANVIEAPKI
jgi:hypothetical protein